MAVLAPLTVATATLSRRRLALTAHRNADPVYIALADYWLTSTAARL